MGRLDARASTRVVQWTRDIRYYCQRGVPGLYTHLVRWSPDVSVTLAVLGLVANAVFELVVQEGVLATRPVGRLREWLGRDENRLAFRDALAATLSDFAREHPDLASSYWDETFLRGGAVPLLAKCLSRQGGPEASELAAAWADQHRFQGDRRSKLIQQVTPAAAFFLESLRLHLGERPEFREAIDSQLFEEMALGVTQANREIGAIRQDLAQIARHFQLVDEHSQTRRRLEQLEELRIQERLGAIRVDANAGYSESARNAVVTLVEQLESSVDDSNLDRELQAQVYRLAASLYLPSEPGGDARCC